MSALNYQIGEDVTPRVPIRRPLVDALCAVTNQIFLEDRRGVMDCTPAARFTVAAILSDGYLLCDHKGGNEGLVLIQASEVEPFNSL